MVISSSASLLLIKFHHIDVSYFIYPFMGWWSFWPVPLFGYYNAATNILMHVFVGVFTVISLRYITYE